jgi:hypothetical protein
MLEHLKSLVQSPRDIFSRASKGIVEPQKSEKIDVAAILMSKNRKERRQFKKQHGIFLHGSTKPIVNAPKGKHKEM